MINKCFMQNLECVFKYLLMENEDLKHHMQAKNKELAQKVN